MNYVLSAPNVTFTDRDTQGGITLTRGVNNSDNITLGSCVTAQIEFEILDLSGTTKHYTGTEFLLSSYDLVPYVFLDEQPLIFRNGDRYYFKANEIVAGYFTAQKPERINESRWKFVCYDRMVKFDVTVDSWLTTLSYPLSLKDMLSSLCKYCGVTLGTTTFTNQNYLVKENFAGNEITGRQILSWIGEIAASYCYINTQGNLVLDWYKPTAVRLEKTISNRVADYMVAKIDKLQVKATEDDIGVIVGTGANAYIIQGNPLLYASTDADIRPCAEAIYTKIKDLSYTPLEAETFSEYASFAPGDIITVKTRLGEYTTCITEMMSNGTKTVVKSTGAENRGKLQSVNSWIKKINGRTNEIKASIDEFSVTLSEVKGETEQNSAQLLVQANQISMKVSQTDYNGNTIASLINQTATTIQIQANKINLNGYVTLSNLTDGSTTISGSNIRTGTISANRLESSVLTTNNIEAKDLTLSGKFYASGYNGSVKIQNGRMEVAYGGNGSNVGAIYYNSGSNTMYIQSGAGYGYAGHIRMEANNDIYIQPGSSNKVYIGTGNWSDKVYIGSSSSNLSSLDAYDYYAKGSRGYTGSITYMKSATSSGTITVKGGIITNVT